MQLHLIRMHGNEKMHMEKEGRMADLSKRGSDYIFGVRLNLKAAKNRNTLIEQSITLIIHPS